MSFPIEIQTERLLLLPFTEADAEEVFARYASDPVVTKFLTWPPHQSVEDTLVFLRQGIKMRAAGKMVVWLIRSREDNRVLGSVGGGVFGHYVQFGYCVAQDSWGQGFATEAARAAVAAYFTNDAICRIQAYCDLENMASARVLEKAGLEREGTLRRRIATENLGGEPRDVYLYARVRDPVVC